VKRPVWILHAFVVGLVLHNFVMAELYAAGIRGGLLELISAWKETLLALGLALVLLARGTSRPRPQLVDLLALGYGAIVVLYGVLPQRWLDGTASARGVVLGVREDLLPVACYFFGRGLQLGREDMRRLATTIFVTAAAAALFGLIDIYSITLTWWRHSGVPGWYSHQLGFSYNGVSNLPENFIYNTGNGHVFRRLVSTLLSPLASSYVFVAALLLASAWRVRERPALRLWLPLVVLLGAGLLWTHSRSSYIALSLGLLVLAWLISSARWPLVIAAVATVLIGLVFVRVYPQIAPTAAVTPQWLHEQAVEAHEAGAGPAVSGFTDASISSHWQSLRAGVKQVFEHPQGFGPGNAGSTAARTGAVIRAGESTYTQLGVDAGLAGAILFVAWSGLLLWRLVLGLPWLAATFAAMLALALQTDILGVPWIVYVIWTLAGSFAVCGTRQGARLTWRSRSA